MTGRQKILLVVCIVVACPSLLAAWVWATIEPQLDAASLPSQPAGSSPAAYSEAVEEGQRLARSFIAEENLPGLSVAVAVDGEIVWAEGFGWADYETERPVTPTTRFRIGSVTQSINAAAAGLLHERGRLDLEAPVQRYLPDFPEKRWPIDTRQLLGHVAGVRHHQGEGEILRRFSCGDDSERLAIFATDPLLFQPGTEYGFSTYGHVLAGAVVASAAEEPWLDFVQREIFLPLGMEHTGADAAGRRNPEQAQVYFPRLALNPRYGMHPITGVRLSCILAAGGLVSTPSDLVRFGSAMIEDKLLEPETTELLQTPVRLRPGESTGAGLGWTVRQVSLGEDRTPTRLVGASGNVAGGAASLMIVPEQGIAIAVTTNVGWTSDRGMVGVMVGKERHVPVGPVSELSTRLADVFYRSTARVQEAGSRPADR